MDKIERPTLPIAVEEGKEDLFKEFSFEEEPSPPIDEEEGKEELSISYKRVLETENRKGALRERLKHAKRITKVNIYLVLEHNEVWSGLYRHLKEIIIVSCNLKGDKEKSNYLINELIEDIMDMYKPLQLLRGNIDEDALSEEVYEHIDITLEVLNHSLKLINKDI